MNSFKNKVIVTKQVPLRLRGNIKLSHSNPKPQRTTATIKVHLQLFISVWVIIKIIKS